MIKEHVSNIFIALAMLLVLTAGGLYFLLRATFSSQYGKVHSAETIETKILNSKE